MFSPEKSLIPPPPGLGQRRCGSESRGLRRCEKIAALPPDVRKGSAFPRARLNIEPFRLGRLPESQRLSAHQAAQPQQPVTRDFFTPLDAVGYLTLLASRAFQANVSLILAPMPLRAGKDTSVTGTLVQIAGKARDPLVQGAQIHLPSVVSRIIPDNHGLCRRPYPARHASISLRVHSSAPVPSTWLRDDEQSGGVSDGEPCRTVSLSKGPLTHGGEGMVKSSTGQNRSRALDFDSIYHAYQPRVYALCLRMSRNRADAEDLTQEAFLRLFRKIDTFRGDSAFTTWLHRLVVNVVLAQLRKKPPVSCSLDSDNRLEEEASPSQEFLGAPDTTLTSAIDRLILKLAVAQLPLGSRTVFVLHDVEGYGHNEIARLLGVSEGTSKSQLHRARGRLRDLLTRGPVRKSRPAIARSSRTGQDRGGPAEAMPEKAWNAVESGALCGRRIHEQATAFPA